MTKPTNRQFFYYTHQEHVHPKREAYDSVRDTIQPRHEARPIDGNRK